MRDAGQGLVAARGRQRVPDGVGCGAREHVVPGAEFGREGSESLGVSRQEHELAALCMKDSRDGLSYGAGRAEHRDAACNGICFHACGFVVTSRWDAHSWRVVSAGWLVG